MRASGGIGEVNRQLIEPKLPLGFVTSMTGHAMADQERPEPIFKEPGVSRLVDAGRRAQSRHDFKQRQNATGTH